MNLPNSRALAVMLDSPRYFDGRPCPRGHVAWRTTANWGCSECQKLKSLAHYHANRDERVEQMRAYKDANRDKVRESSRKWKQQNPEKVRAGLFVYLLDNAERAAEWNRAYKKKHRARMTALQNERKAMQLRAAPSWLTDEHKAEIHSRYEEARRLTQETGIPHHVDHIHPLKSAFVCGLHVPWNLRVIPARENISKGNRLIEDAA
jgi:hypothetical protein